MGNEVSALSCTSRGRMPRSLDEGFDRVVFACSVVDHARVMHQASVVLALGADFVLLGPERTMLRAGVPVIAMDFAVTPDDGLSPDVVAARAEREAKSEAALRANAERVTDLPAFAEWLYTTHLCYAVTRQHEIGEFAEMKSDPALKSY